MSVKTDYILGPLIARGGMAEIFLGKVVGDDNFGRLCAIKRILPHHAGDKEFVRMFRDEAHICKRLQHANIVQVYDFQDIGGSYAIVMEYIDGNDLRSLLAACEKSNTRLTIPMAVYVAAQAARGLHYAHTKIDEITQQPLGIVHRDISPQNILVSYEGEVKVTDFGIADADDKVSETLPGTVKGKYSYMSPEQIAVKDLDPRTDIFSLAIVLWEILAMRRLFAGKNEIETIKRVQSAEIRYKLTDLNPKVDKDLLNIVQKGLTKERRHRYQAASHFEKDLLRYLHSHYPDFTSNELGSFLKKLMAKRRGEIARDIKKTLTSTNLKGQRPSTYEEASAPNQENSKVSGDHRNQPSEQSAAQPSHKRNAFEQDSKSSENPSTSKADFSQPISSMGKPFSLILDDSSMSRVNPVKIDLELDPPKDRANFSVQDASSQPNRAQAYTTPVNTKSYRQNGDDDFASRLRYSIVRSKVQRPTSYRRTNVMAIAAICFAVGLLWYGLRWDELSRSAGQTGSGEFFTLRLTTLPAIVQLELGNKPLESGRFVKTPIEIPRIPAGIHNLTIKRPGFNDRQLSISGRAGGHITEDRIVLERDSNFRRAPTIVRLRGAPRIDYIVNGGLHRGQLEQSTPQAFDDLAYGQQHSIAVRIPSGEPILCRFTPLSDSFRRPYEITISVNQRNIRCSVRAP